MKIIDQGISTKLKFGKNRDLNFITISEINTTCDENFEIARRVFIQNEHIMKSECEKKERLLVLNTKRSSNTPKMIFFPSKYSL